MEELLKVPEKALIEDLKKQLSVYRQQLAANEQYILELEEQLRSYQNISHEEALVIKTNGKVRNLQNNNTCMQHKIRDLRKENERYLVKLLSYEKKTHTDNTQ